MSRQKIKSYIATNHGDCNATALRAALKKGVEAGFFVADGAKFKLGAAAKKAPKKKAAPKKKKASTKKKAATKKKKASSKKK